MTAPRKTKRQDDATSWRIPQLARWAGLALLCTVGAATLYDASTGWTMSSDSGKFLSGDVASQQAAQSEVLGRLNSQLAELGRMFVRVHEMSSEGRTSHIKVVEEFERQVDGLSSRASKLSEAHGGNAQELASLRSDLNRLLETLKGESAAEPKEGGNHEQSLSQLLSQLSQIPNPAASSTAAADSAPPSAEREDILATLTRDEFQRALHGWYLSSFNKNGYQHSKNMTKELLGAWFSLPPDAPKQFCTKQPEGHLPGLGGIIYLIKAGKGNFWRCLQAQDTWIRHIGPQDRVLFLADEDVEWNEDHKKLQSVLRVPVHSLWPDCRHPDPKYNEGCSPYHLLPLKVGYGLQAAAEVAEQAGLDPSWYVILDDDTFVVPKNMRRVLGPYDPHEAHVMGNVGVSRCPGMCGGAGWAMSKKAVAGFRENYEWYMEECKKGVPHSVVFDDALLPNFLTGVRTFETNLMPQTIKAKRHDIVEMHGYAPRSRQQQPEKWIGEYVSNKWNQLIAAHEDRQGGFMPCTATFHTKDQTRDEEINKQLMSLLAEIYLHSDPDDRLALEGPWRLVDGWRCDTPQQGGKQWAITVGKCTDKVGKHFEIH
eukprot:gnl/TRDRNA2_/TRDRNA2_30573_c0_seq1.p1 gnl/TRDRNA2_/TRDRNA2_30573_c0~~gnl/TRDRNA2_/TRDRNA2_30573_c0_seq1.p1  ORF type:complete len:597 (-),score=90.02 gnl/TRDRNA2_/TRDRNA2_30573_c0_seq1:63-1853(-)